MTKDDIIATSSPNLLNIPEYVLRILLSYFDATTLYQLARTCTYLKDFIEDPVFWKYVDARKNPNTDKKTSYILERIHENTTHLFLRSVKRCGQIPNNFFDVISPFENLRILSLENQKLYGSKVSLKDFPPGLEELSLKKTLVRQSVYFFRHSVQQMQNLRVLILDECGWVTSSFLLSVSKYENLEIISAVKCTQVHLNVVPYLNVAKYGCKKLKVLDLRFTAIGSELLRTFYSKQSLQNIYFQSFASCEIDYGFKMDFHYKTFEESDDRGDSSITDSSLMEYFETTALRPVEPITKSVLYKDPYPRCTCESIDRDRDIPTLPLKDEYIPFKSANQTTTFVCPKHMDDVADLPDNIKEFFQANQRQCMSDYTSDVDTDSDSSESGEERSCCIYAMGRKMIYLPNGNNFNDNSEIVLPGIRDRDDLPFNIVIVNTEALGANAEPNSTINQQFQANNNADMRLIRTVRRSTWGNEYQGDAGPSTSNANKRKNAEDSEDSDSEPSPKTKRRCSQVTRKHRLSSGDSESHCRNPKKSRNDPSEDITNRYVLSSSSDDDSCAGPSVKDKSPKRKKSSEGSTKDSGRQTNNGPHNRLEGGADAEDNIRPLREHDLHQHELHSRERRISEGVNIINERISVFLNRYHVSNVLRIGIRDARWPRKKISLRRLSLRGYARVTDATLRALTNLDLQLLDLTFTNVTKKGMEEYLSINPNCRIIHPLYCICKPQDPFLKC